MRTYYPYREINIFLDLKGGLKMNIKVLTKILLVLVLLTISVGIVTAADSDAVALESSASNLDKNVLTDRDWDDYWDDDDDWDDKYDDWDDRYDDDHWRYYKYNAPKKVKPKVSANSVVAKHKKNSAYKIKVKDKYERMPLDNVKLKVKIGKGYKSKTFKVKTNSYGIAKINAKRLKTGTHRVVITSADNKYNIFKTKKLTVTSSNENGYSKNSKFIRGKEYQETIEGTGNKVLKNNDVIGLNMRYDDDDKEYRIVFKKNNKHTKITKATFFFKNRYTGQVIAKTDWAEFDDGRWELPEEDCSYAYTLQKVKVSYISV